MKIKNILSFDIEGLIESSHDSMYIPEKYINQKEENYQITENTEQILKVLSTNNVKATFFILGRIARDIPDLVNRISQEGHEIASHSLDHYRLYNFSREEIRNKLDTSKKFLEDACGKEIIGFRAPDFSIVQKNIYVFDELLEAGYKYDSSVYPIGMHDVYGISDFEDTPFKMNNGLIELPMSTVKFFNKSIPFGGGGYFRIFPFFLTKLFLKNSNAHNRPMNFYLHPYEIGKEVTYISEIPLIRKFRTYYGVSGVENKIKKLIKQASFGRADQFIFDNNI
jgi:polysaccharide deacetylase family protein (PEP-CTERM system associated)